MILRFCDSHTKLERSQENVTVVSTKENNLCLLQSFNGLQKSAITSMFWVLHWQQDCLLIDGYFFPPSLSFSFLLLKSICSVFLERQMLNTYVKLLQYSYSRSAKSAFPQGNTNFWPELFGITINRVLYFFFFFSPLVPGYDLIRVYHMKSEISECWAIALASKSMKIIC